MTKKRKKIKSQTISKKERKFREMIETCVKNARNSKRKERENQEWWARYKKQFESFQMPESSPSCLQGNTSKKSIFDSRNFVVKDDEDLINNKRQCYGMEPLDQSKDNSLEEAKRKAKQVAPAFNKGAYQYITSKENIKNN